MSRWPTRRPSRAILSVVLLASACTSGTPVGTASGPVPASPNRPGPSVPATSPTSAAQPTVAPSVLSADPPPASLAAEGGEPVVGQLGSFTWGDGGSDSPWLPGAPLTVGSGEPLTVSIAGGVAVASWSASRVPRGSTNGTGAVALGAGVGPVAFAAPAPGNWSVQASVRFAGGLGSATYYWQLTVH
jgi:hypothetical protein